MAKDEKKEWEGNEARLIRFDGWRVNNRGSRSTRTVSWIHLGRYIADLSTRHCTSATWTQSSTLAVPMTPLHCPVDSAWTRDSEMEAFRHVHGKEDTAEGIEIVRR